MKNAASKRFARRSSRCFHGADTPDAAEVSAGIFFDPLAAELDRLPAHPKGRVAQTGQSIGLRNRLQPWVARFWKKAERRGDCLIWTSSKSSSGYGQFTYSYAPKRWVSAHRIAWELYHGSPPPAGMVVMHSCDNRLCIAREHLSLGTVAENNADAWLKGRGRTGTSKDFLFPPRRRRGHVAAREATPANTNGGAA